MDYDEIVQNAADGGNHNDTFSTGEDFGHLNGEIYAYNQVLKLLVDV